MELTNEQIDAMEPGIEMDRLVVKKVFNESYSWVPFSTYFISTEYIINELKEKGFYVEMNNMESWWVLVFPDTTECSPLSVVDAEANTLPHAVCKAALKLMVKLEEDEAVA